MGSLRGFKNKNTGAGKKLLKRFFSEIGESMILILYVCTASFQISSYLPSLGCGFFRLTTIDLKRGTIFQTFIYLRYHDTLVSRTNDLIHIDQLFDTMCTPSHNTCHCKDWCEQLLRNTKHAVNKSAVKIHIGTNAFIDRTLFTNYFRCDPLDHGI